MLPGHAAVLAKCSEKLLGDQSLNPEEQKTILDDLVQIDWLSVPTVLISPLLFYHRNRRVLSDPTHPDFSVLETQLKNKKQCVVQRNSDDEENVMREIATLRAEVERLRAAIDARQVKHRADMDRLRSWYDCKKNVLKQMLSQLCNVKLAGGLDITKTMDEHLSSTNAILNDLAQIEWRLIPMDLICPLLFYHHNRTVLSNPHHEYFLDLKTQLENIMQCVVQHRPNGEEKSSTDMTALYDEVENMRAAAAAQRDKHQGEMHELEDRYEYNESILKRMQLLLQSEYDAACNAERE